jgi:hypothetical protein
LPSAVVAVMVVLPFETAVTTPIGLILAMDVLLELHVMLQEAFDGTMMAFIVSVSPTSSERFVKVKVIPVGVFGSFLHENAKKDIIARTINFKMFFPIGYFIQVFCC